MKGTSKRGELLDLARGWADTKRHLMRAMRKLGMRVKPHQSGLKVTLTIEPASDMEALKKKTFPMSRAMSLVNFVESNHAIPQTSAAYLGILIGRYLALSGEGDLGKAIDEMIRIDEERRRKVALSWGGVAAKSRESARIEAKAKLGEGFSWDEIVAELATRHRRDKATIGKHWLKGLNPNRPGPRKGNR